MRKRLFGSLRAKIVTAMVAVVAAAAVVVPVALAGTFFANNANRGVWHETPGFNQRSYAESCVWNLGSSQGYAQVQYLNTNYEIIANKVVYKYDSMTCAGLGPASYAKVRVRFGDPDNVTRYLEGHTAPLG